MLISQHINSFRLNNKQHKAAALLSGVKGGGGVIERKREAERKRMNEREGGRFSPSRTVKTARIIQRSMRWSKSSLIGHLKSKQKCWERRESDDLSAEHEQRRPGQAGSAYTPGTALADCERRARLQDAVSFKLHLWNRETPAYERGTNVCLYPHGHQVRTICAQVCTYGCCIIHSMLYLRRKVLNV